MRGSHIARVILWMAGALLAFSTMAVSIRELSRAGLSIFEIFTIRSATALIILGLLLLVRPELRRQVRPHRFGFNVVRNTVHYGAQFAWAYGVTMLPLALVFALEFTAPMWTALLAAWFLREKLTPSRIGVVILGLIGILVILRPGFASFNPAAGIVLLAAIGFAVMMIMTKSLTGTQSTFSIIFWMAVIQLPLSLIGVSPLVLAAPVNQPGVPAGADARAFLQAARQAGDRWSYGTPGVGTVGHLGTELLKARTGIAPVHIPYPGYPQVATAMLGGQLQMALLPPALAQAQERAGKLRLIGVTSAGRSALVPHVPSLSEAGVRDFQLEIWNAFAAPASMPAPVRARLSALIGETARSPEVRAKLFQQGWQAVGSSAEGLANRMRADTATMSRVIREQGIRAE